MALIDHDKELVEAQVSRILDRHRSWLTQNYQTESIRETLKRSSAVYDQVLSLSFPVFGVGMVDRICLVALGSYGREEVCPHSDLDLLILYQDLPLRKIENFSVRLLGLLWDQKIQVGHSLRTKEQCLKLAEKDFSVLTALLDARPIIGNFDLFRELFAGFEKLAASQRKPFFLAKYDELIARWIKHKNVIWVTEPQVMEGMGGLREWHHIRWFSRACLGMESPEQLVKAGLLDAKELKSIHAGLARLLKLRVALHIMAGEKNDLLELELQEPVAKCLGIEPGQYPNRADALLEWALSGSELMVEALDRMLFVLNRKYREEKPEPIAGVNWLQKEQGYLSIVAPGFMKKLDDKPEAAMGLFKAVARSGLALAPLSRKMVLEKSAAIKKQLKTKVMELFAPDLRTSAAIKEIKHMGLAKSLFPELENAFFMGQRDGYHKYTVGWHSVLCLEKIEQAEQAPEFGDDPEINWPALKLAGLVHDLGKGSGEEHAHAGAAIGLKVAKRFGLDPESTGLLEFLVREHLLLNHYASRRDYYEPKAIETLVSKIKDQARLKMLYILTCADIQAVSESSWTNWKDDLLRRLYHMLIAQFEKKETPTKQLSDRVSELKKLMLQNGISGGLLSELEKMPTRYLLGTAPEKIVEHLRMIDEKNPGEIKINIKMLQKPRLEVVVSCDDYPGLFSDLSGVMSALNYNILSAEINTIDNTVLDIFVVEDLVSSKTEDWDSEVAHRNARLESTLADAIEKRISVEELVSKKKGIFKPKTRLEIPVDVHFDQESSDHYTIIEVQAPDQTGLLYKITRSIFEHGIDIQFAKISTRADKVFDVFYLRDPVSKGKADNDGIAKLVKSLQLSLKAKS